MRATWRIERLGDLSNLITKGTTPTSVGHAFIPDGIPAQPVTKKESAIVNITFFISGSISLFIFLPSFLKLFLYRLPVPFRRLYS